MHDLSRFLEAQDNGVYEKALKELQGGRKESHWMWFIFPQIRGLGRSPMAQRYAIGGLEEARAYLRHPILGVRLRECCEALLAVEGKSAFEILGDPDDMKLRSSMSLFAAAEDANETLFGRVLDRFFAGNDDIVTRERIAAKKHE